MLPLCARAMDDGVLDFNVLASELYDNNLFRLPDGVTPAVASGETSRSDFVTSTGIGLKLDKPYSLQRFTANADLVHYDYRQHSYLNYNALNGDAAWHWTLTPSLTGEVSYVRTESLNSFADFTGVSQRNIDTNENRRIAVDWMLGEAWHTALALSQLQQHNDLPVLTLEDVRIRSAEASLRYVFLTGNSLTAYFRDGSGKYLNRDLDPVNQIDTGFTERESGIRASWQITGKSGLFGQAGYLSRDHDNFSSRDFSGVVGQIRYHWNITGKTELEADASRTLGSYQAPTSSYLVTDTVGIGPNWDATAAIHISARYLSTVYQYRGALVGVGSLRRDIVRGTSLTAQWQVSRPFSIGVSWVHSNRGSNTAGLEYSDNTAMVSAKATF